MIRKLLCLVKGHRWETGAKCAVKGQRRCQRCDELQELWYDGLINKFYWRKRNDLY